MLTKCHFFIKEDIEKIVSHVLPWEKFSGCSILITGANGFLGTYLVRTLCSLYRSGLVAEPVKIVAIVRDLKRAQRNFEDLLGRSEEHTSELQSLMRTSYAV